MYFLSLKSQQYTWDSKSSFKELSHCIIFTKFLVVLRHDFHSNHKWKKKNKRYFNSRRNHDRKEKYANLLPIQISTLAFQFRAHSGYPFSSLMYKNKSNINSITVISIYLYHTYIIPNSFYISRYRQKHFIQVSILFLFFHITAIQTPTEFCTCANSML